MDLFAGAGGLSHGFLKTNRYKSVLAFEKNAAAQATYKKNHRDTEVLGDITTFKHFNNYKDEVDVIIGGPPCQGFSNANRQKFNFISDNNSLVKSYILFILRMQPKAFLMENVATFPSETHRFFVSEQEREQSIFTCYLKEESIEIYEGKLAEILFDKVMRKEDLKLNERMIRDVGLIVKRHAQAEKISRTNIVRIKNSVASYFDNCVLTTDNSLEKDLEFRSMKIVERFVEELRTLTEEELLILNEYLSFQKSCLILNDIRKNKIFIKKRELQDTRVILYLDSIKVEDYLIASLDKTYNISREVLNAAEFGVPQKRRRYMALGVKKGLTNVEQIDLKRAIPQVETTTVKDAIFDLESLSPNYNVNDEPIKICKEYVGKLHELRNSKLIYNHIITQSREQSLERFKVLKPGQNFHDLSEEITLNYANRERTQNSVYRRLDYEEISPTVTNVRKAMWIHPTQDRAISVREAARIQTFDDDFIFTGTKDEQYQQVGNAVPPLMAQYIGEWLVNILDEIK